MTDLQSRVDEIVERLAADKRDLMKQLRDHAIEPGIVSISRGSKILTKNY